MSGINTADEPPPPQELTMKIKQRYLSFIKFKLYIRQKALLPLSLRKIVLSS